MAFFKPLNFSLYKTQGADFASICPYMIMIDEGIVLLKGGALTCAYEFLAPDLASSSAAKINGIATMFNNAIIQKAGQYNLNCNDRIRIPILPLRFQISQGILLNDNEK